MRYIPIKGLNTDLKLSFLRSHWYKANCRKSLFHKSTEFNFKGIVIIGSKDELWSLSFGVIFFITADVFDSMMDFLVPNIVFVKIP